MARSFPCHYDHMSETGDLHFLEREGNVDCELLFRGPHDRLPCETSSEHGTAAEIRDAAPKSPIRWVKLSRLRINEAKGNSLKRK